METSQILSAELPDTEGGFIGLEPPALLGTTDYWLFFAIRR